MNNEFMLAEKCECHSNNATELCNHPTLKGKNIRCGMMFLNNCNLSPQNPKQ